MRTLALRPSGPLTTANARAAKEALAQRQRQSSDGHHATIDELTLGDRFWAAIQDFGQNENGDPLRLNHWHQEYAYFLADTRLKEHQTWGAMQLSKTSFHVLWGAFQSVNLGLDIYWIFDSQPTMFGVVPQLQQRWLDRWLAHFGDRSPRGTTRKIDFWQFARGSIEYTYASTTKPKTKNDGAAAGAPAMSRRKDALFNDESSKIPQGALDPFRTRVAESRYREGPIYTIGTPGAGGGIEATIAEKADYQFSPHFDCPGCGETIELTPDGCLLKPYQRVRSDGSTETAYLNEGGRPKDWFHSDPSNPVNSAYFACSNCGRPISLEERTERSHYRCTKTGVAFADFLARPLPSTLVEPGASFWLSPLLRPKESAAVRIIRTGLTTHNVADWRQQECGLPSTIENSNLTRNFVEGLIGRESAPFTQPDLTAVGIDQGRGQHWLIACDVWLPEGEHLSESDALEAMPQRIRAAEAIPESEICDRLRGLKRPGVPLQVVIDNEPERATAARLIRGIQSLGDGFYAIMADQRSISKTDILWNQTVQHGGEEFEACHFDNGMLFLRTQRVWWNGRVEVPRSWERWRGIASADSPITHLITPGWDSDRNKPDGKRPNDLYYAFMFGQVAIAAATID